MEQIKEQKACAKSKYIDCCYMRVAWMEINCLKGSFSVIVHGPNGCGWDYGMAKNIEGHNFYCTNLSDIDIIMGGEEKLKKTILSISKKEKPGVLFVLGTCVSELIGDDVKGVASQCSKETGIKTIVIPSSGLSGIVKRPERNVALFELIKSAFEKNEIIPESFNYLGGVWSNTFGIKDEIKSCLSEIGIKLCSCLSGESEIDEIFNAPNASLNVFIDVNDANFLGNAMKTKFGQNYLVNIIHFGLRNGKKILKVELKNILNLYLEKELP